MKIVITVFLFNLLTISCMGQSIFNYDLDKPNIQHQLPAILNEISGLTDIDSYHVACIQDELGIVFIYNFRKGEIVSQHNFDSVGDFEGLTYTHNALYILRSDGRLSEWSNFPENLNTINHYKLSLLTSNNEGLCFDPKHKRILIAAKSKPLDKDKKSERFIYSFDLADKELQEKPIYRINVEHLEEKSRDFNIHQINVTAKGKIKPFNFRPASLAVHPLTDKIYVISASDKLLLIMNRNGEVIHIEQLSSERFIQAEGITFLHDGTMIITNEAADSVPTLYVFKMKSSRD